MITKICMNINMKSNTIKNRDLQIAIAVFLAGLSCFGLLYYYQALLPDLVEYFKINKAKSSFAVSSATLGMALGLITSTFVADRYSRKKVIGYCLFASAVLAFTSSFSENFNVLIALNFLKGFLLSGATSVCLAYIAEEVSENRKLRITGFYIAGNAVGGMIGRVISSQVSHYKSWQFASEFIGIWCLIFAILFFILAPKSQNFKPKKESFKTLIEPNFKLITHPKLLPFYITGFLLLGTFVSLYKYMAFFLVKAPFNISRSWISYVYVLYISGVFGSMNVSFWERKLKNSENVLKTMSLVGILGILFFFLQNTIAVIVGLAVFTYSFFVAHTVCSKSVGNFSKEKRTVTIAFYLLLYYIGASTLGSFSGVILQRLDWQVFLVFLTIIFGIIYLIFVFKKEKIEP